MHPLPRQNTIFTGFSGGFEALLVSSHRFSFNGQERTDEIAGTGNHTTALYWEYDTRLGRRWNVDPLIKSHESPYATFANNPIWFVDPIGADTCFVDNFGNSETIHFGGDDVLLPVLGSLSNPAVIQGQISFASSSWKSFINSIDEEEFESYVFNLYQSKLLPYKTPSALNRGLYGANTNGDIDLPSEITNRIWNEASLEAMPTLKMAWSIEQSGVDPNSLSYLFNFTSRALFNNALANTVSSDEEGWSLVSKTGLAVATAWLISMNSTSQTLQVLRYPNSNGGGINMSISGKRTLGLDWHRFKLGGKVNGRMVNRPHVDIPGLTKHWPWHQINRWNRGIR